MFSLLGCPESGASAKRIGKYGYALARLIAGILRSLKANAGATAEHISKPPIGIHTFSMQPFTAPVQSVAGAFQLLKLTERTNCFKMIHRTFLNDPT